MRRRIGLGTVGGYKNDKHIKTEKILQYVDLSISCTREV